MDNKKVQLTQAGYDKIQEELNRMNTVEMPRIIQAIADARALGDLSENADYSAAREEQALLQSKIDQYKYMVDHAEIIEKDDSGKVGPNATVTYMDLADNITETVTIVGSFETNPKEGKISTECPLAQALNDHVEGETVLVSVEQPYEVLIMKVE